MGRISRGSKLCECGCGEPVAKLEHRFIHHHHVRVDNPLGRPENTGANHHKWRGDEVGYSGAHRRLEKAKPKTGRCEQCGSEGYTEYAYKGSALEYSADPDDYRELCSSCHHRWDLAKREGPHPNTKFSDELVEAIRASYTGARGEQVAIIRRYGISKTHLRRLLQGTRT